MFKALQFPFAKVALLGLATLTACTVTSSTPSSQPLTVQTPPPEGETAPPPASENVSLSSFAAAAQQPSSEQIPIETEDAVWGNPQAAITVVEFMDLQCPFCLRVSPTLESLKRRYEGNLRIVWKHNPLPFHHEAKPAALFAQAVLAASGSDTFFRFVARVFQDQRNMGLDALKQHAADLGLDANRILELSRAPAVVQKVERDMALAVKVGLAGPPSFLL
jgi:protein-disulfide isomerase